MAREIRVDEDHLGNQILGATVPDPTTAQQIASKAYVDAIATGLDVKASVRAATTAALPANTRTGNSLTATANGALAAQDGVTLVLNDRLLVKNEAAGANNGLYFVAQVGTGGTPFILTRTTDADSSAEVTPGLFTFVEEGTLNGDTGWVLTTDGPVTLNTTALVFTQFSGPGSTVAGNGLTRTGSTLSVLAADATITVGPSGISVTSPKLKAAANFGDGVSLAYVVNHNFGTRDVQVQVYRNSTPWDTIECTVERTDANNVTLRFTGTAPTTNELRVVILG